MYHPSDIAPYRQRRGYANDFTLDLRLRGIDVLTVQEDGLTAAPDSLLLDCALDLSRILFSQDQDFLIEDHHRQNKGIPFTGVIYADQLGRRRQLHPRPGNHC